ncbi:bifunctional chorismate mutase/prephenate dehydrogenase [Ignicoccus hospitalis]|uniref:Chorismate mutase n=1 Tax=Ignicoccus hospitalis (strain KIN4/I / DSM 18386 / JCM 14125) TaxID=453591 RepID=A8AAX2_IGNH4|nr:bifunctional chorismate mutase/prephenate dehydrogenase [Ignicoccus hospitalis]ABU82074.1 chorismate mutase [Ignicoccus hospitalis KIN4/I]HIH91031.1 bifunctional chorismate mutase/prephenate dehydrogenase [Desulfurococcaceae archaeon]
MSENPLESLKVKRRELDKLDKEILRLLKRRFEIVKEITDTKKNLGLPVYDRDREEEVMVTRTVWGLELGIPQEFTKEMFKMILEESKKIQLYTPEKVYVGIYGYGGMGEQLVKVFSRAGHRVVVTGRNLEKAEGLAKRFKVEWGEPKEVAKEVEWLILAVPPKAVPGLVKELAPLMRSGALLSDISSVKKTLVEEVLKVLPEYIEYISLHPLFGPEVEPLGETVVVVPVKSYDYWVRLVQNIFVSMGFEVITSTPEEHDRAMAVTQVLHHFALVSLDEAAKKLSKEYGVDYMRYATRSFKKTLETIQRLKELSEVIDEIQEMNEYAAHAREEFLKVASQMDKRWRKGR